MELARLAAVLVLGTSSLGCQTAPYAGPVYGRADFSQREVDVEGVLIGAAVRVPGTDPALFFSELELLRAVDDTFDTVTWRSGFGGRWPEFSRVRAGLDLDMGYGNVEVDAFSNRNWFASYGGSAVVEVWLQPRVALFGRASLRRYVERTRGTTCNDGTTTDDEGAGACEGHGGVDFANDLLGDGTIGVFTVGVLFQL